LPNDTASSASSSGEKPSGRRANLIARVATAVVGIPVVLGLNYIGSWPFAVALALVAVLGYHEFHGMARRLDATTALPLGLAACAGLALVSPIVTQPQTIWVAVLVGVAMLAGAWFLVPANYEHGALGWILTLAGVAYIGLLAAHLGLLRQAHDGAWWVLVALLITWGYDTGAYFTGSAIGRHAFMHHVSPSKTVEGVVGGLVLSTAVALIAVPGVHLTVPQALLLGLLGGAVAQTGDLVESMLKRQTGVKDSGTLIPGHGGVLDRVDSLLFVAAFTYYMARVTGHAA
jgi:phosphatidate cytidylyltransferase